MREERVTTLLLAMFYMNPIEHYRLPKKRNEYSCLSAFPNMAIHPIKSLKLWKEHMVGHYEGSNSAV